jgi:hypothetical protein
MRKHGFETVESEIRKEKAEALGRAGERLEPALQEVKTFRQEIFDLVAGGPEAFLNEQGRFQVEIEQKLTEYARLCEQTRQLRHSLIIQREAVGLWRHDDVDRQYPLPGPLTLPETTPPGGDR